MKRAIVELYKDIDACQGCSLGGAHVIRPKPHPVGNPDSGIVLIGEGPGKQEEWLSEVFVGPAGKLLYKMFSSVGVDLKNDTYLCNVIKCRARAEEGTNKENVTPTVTCQKACTRRFLNRELNILKPRVIVTLGKQATNIMLGGDSRTPLKNQLGPHTIFTPIPSLDPFQEWQTAEMYENLELIYVLYHPASFLHVKSDPKMLEKLKRTQHSHLLRLKELI